MSMPESRSCVRVLIVDDHPVVRAGLASLLRRQPGVKLSGAAHSGEEALEVLKRMSVDVILLDLRMPAINGIDLLNLLNVEPSPPRAIIL
jgi:two-component system, NarL family, response regulator